MQWPVTGALVRAAIAIADSLLATRFGNGTSGIFLAVAAGMATFGILSLPSLIWWVGDGSDWSASTRPRSGTATRNLEEDMSRTKESQNKALVLEAFNTLFNKRDYVAAERYWSPHYIQHSAHIEPGRDGLFNLIKSVPATLKYEPGVIVADGDFVIVHGRFSGHGRPKSWIAADILRIVDGVLVEHWDVLQDEASQAESKSGLPMFGGSFTE
jgi:predicted SnoaL-like aldol condensation-catalyzing enzyme